MPEEDIARFYQPQLPQGSLIVPDFYATEESVESISNWKLWLGWEMLTGDEITAPKVVGELRKLSLRRVLTHTKILANLMNDFHKFYDLNVQCDIADKLLPEALSPRAIALLRDRAEVGALFHRQQILFLMKLGILVCDTDRRTPPLEKTWDTYARAALMSSDVLDQPLELDDDDALALISVFSTTQRGECMPLAMARQRTLWSEVFHNLFVSIDTMRVSEVDLAHTISFDVDPLLYAMGIFLPPKDSSPHKCYITLSSAFRSGRERKRTARVMLDFASHTPQEFQSQLLDQTQHSYTRDMSTLHQFPMVRIGRKYYCYDSKVFTSFLNSGLFWRVKNAAHPSLGKQLDIRLGQAMEKYVFSLFENACSQKQSQALHLLKQPQYRNSNDQVADLIVFGKHSIILVEIKSSLLTPHAKYSLQPGAFWKDINAKFIKGVGKGRKGLSQLATNSRLVAEGKQIRSIHKSPDEFLIAPVLIVQEDALTSPFMPDKLSREFTRLLKDETIEGHEILPPTILDLEDVEVLNGLSKIDSIEKVLLTYSQTNKRQPQPFSWFRSRNYPQFKWSMSSAWEITEKLPRELRKFFPGKES